MKYLPHINAHCHYSLYAIQMSLHYGFSFDAAKSYLGKLVTLHFLFYAEVEKGGHRAPPLGGTINPQECY